jgi:hypothetical protein
MHNCKKHELEEDREMENRSTYQKDTVMQTKVYPIVAIELQMFLDSHLRSLNRSTLRL